VRIDVGVDDDGDNVLDPLEIDATQFACSVAAEVPAVTGLRTKLMLCGTSFQDINAFIPQGVNLTLSSSCEPDDDTQALFVSRDIGSFGNLVVDTSVFRDYVRQGGVVVTEFFSSAPTFNGVFCGPVQDGLFTGGCSDSIPTVVQFNPTDPFWIENAFNPIQEFESGCGSDVSAFPGITPLAGWSADSVSIAYRDRGAGRLWLADFDWQDGSANAETVALMGYMMTHRR